MSPLDALKSALSEIKDNKEQHDAVQQRRHCIVLAGPGSGKTKTLTTAIARTLAEEVVEPRGIACITFNNECAFELESKLARLGIDPSERIFIGTVHSFALTQIIVPYARIVLKGFPTSIRVATETEVRESQQRAYDAVFQDGGDAKDRWEFAKEKRFRDVDRTALDWRGRNEELSRLIEAYEADLRRSGLIDLVDMPLLAYRILNEAPWVRTAIKAKFPVLFVDEYQDLGHALHELVLLLCFSGNIRLFAVGDTDQSIYSFNGANPSLLKELSQRPNVYTVHLRLNYRSSQQIVNASIAALRENRDYVSSDPNSVGTITFSPVSGDAAAQAQDLVQQILPKLHSNNIEYGEIAVLYKGAKQGDLIATAVTAVGIPITRADNQALILRKSRMLRLVEASARWTTTPTGEVPPPFAPLAAQAVSLVLGYLYADNEKFLISCALMNFLKGPASTESSAYSWLTRFRDELINPWRRMRRTVDDDEWSNVDALLEKLGRIQGDDLSLAQFAGRGANSQQLVLSTLHSAKGREFEAVVLFDMNDKVIPNYYERQVATKLQEARRLFYVGISRAKKEVYIQYNYGRASQFVTELQRDLTT